MKIVRIFGIVLALHVVMLLVFFQPGCQSKPRPQPEQTGGSVSSTGPAEQLDWESPDYTTQVEPLERQRSSPTRPASESVRSRSQVEEPLQPLQPLQPLPSVSSAPSVSSPRETSSSGVYTVQRGDNLSAISQRHNVSLSALLSINGLNKNSIIRPGQELLIPAGGSARPTASSSSSSPSSAPAGTETYTVVRGDSLSRIASRHGTTVGELKELNNLSSDTIRVDQKLIVPKSGGGSASRSSGGSSSASSAQSSISSRAAASGEEHVVKSGETPGGIASRYGISVDELMSANNMSDPRRMQIGQKLVIPGKKAETSTAASSASRPAPRQPAPTAPVPAPVSTAAPTTAPRPRDPVLDPRPVQVLPSDEVSEDEFPIIPVLPEN